MSTIEIVALAGWAGFVIFGTVGWLTWVTVGPVAKKD